MTASEGTLLSLVEQGAAIDPTRTALCAPDDETMSYAALLEALGGVQEGLARAGVGRGDRVAIVLPDGPRAAAVAIGVACAATAAPLNPAHETRELEELLHELEARAVVVEAGARGPAAEIARRRSLPLFELRAEASSGPDLLELVTGERAEPPRTVEPPRPRDVALVLGTSGTTARRKLVLLEHAHLSLSANQIGRSLALGTADRCLSVMPLFHVHGFVGALLASLGAGSSVACLPGFYAPRFFAWIEELAPTWYTAVPTMHRSIVERGAARPGGTGRGTLRFVRSASAPLPTTLLARLEDLFAAPVIEAYGMTEAAHQIASNPLPPSTRKAGSVGLPTGPEIEIVDPAGRPQPAGRPGEVLVRGPSVITSYGNPTEASSFLNGWLRTGDEGYRDDDGFLFLTGRSKEMINRGGEKISPHEIDEALLEHPGIEQAVCFAVPDERLGEEVAAAVVTRDQSLDEGEVLTYLGARLARHKTPRMIVFTDEIPAGPTGKVQRLRLAERLGIHGIEPRQPAQTAYVEARTPVEVFLLSIWREVLEVERIGVHDHFLDLGGDSLLAARVVARICAELALDLPVRALFESPTIAEQAAAVEELLPHATGHSAANAAR